MAKGNPARLRASAHKLKSALDKIYSGKLYPRSGVVTTVTYDNSGPRQATVALGGGATERVNVAGMNGIEPGAEMELQYLDGSLVNTRVTRRVAAASGTPSQPLSTPIIDSVTTIVDFGAPSGETLAGRGHVGSVPSPTAQGIVLCRAIPEQLADVRLVYDLEIAVATGPLAGRVVWFETSSERGLARGWLLEELDDAADGGDLIILNAYQGGWPNGPAVVTLGDLGTDESEHVWVSSSPWPRAFPDLGYSLEIAPGAIDAAHDVRGYNGAAFPEGETSAQTWPAGTAVTLSSAGLSFAGLAVDRLYQARVRARAQGGAVSGWSEWTNFMTATDTTAPGWSGDNTPEVTAATRSFLVSWPAADVYAGGVVDLAYYELRHSPDDATWEAVTVGQGTSYVLPGEPGEGRYFQVRAVDTSGNASAWSPSGSATIEPPPIPYGNLLTNPGFESALGAEWDWNVGMGSGTLTRVTSPIRKGSYAARLVIGRSDTIQVPGELNQDIVLSPFPTAKWTISGWLYIEHLLPGETISISLGAGYDPRVGPLAQELLPQGKWLYFEDTGRLSASPAGGTTIVFGVNVTALPDLAERDLVIYVDELHASVHA